MATVLITKEQEAAEEKKKMVTLVSSDGKKFVVEQKVAEQSVTIKAVMACCGIESPIPVHQVSGDVLSPILEYCEKHAEEKKETEEWDREYMEKAKTDLDFLHNFLLADHFVQIPELIDLLAKTFADMIRMKTPEQIRQMLNIKNDLTKEQEERIQAEFGWAFQ